MAICVIRVAFVVLLLLLTPFAAPSPVLAQDARDSAHGDEPGQFDFYVLSLSWSPSF
jgi:ribonuclease I